MCCLCCFSHVINFLVSESANNFGTFLGGLGTFVLPILGIITFFYGASSISRWKTEKRAEATSNIAENVLNIMDECKSETEQWVEMVYFTFPDKHDGREAKPENDEFLVTNYANKLQPILKSLNRGKNLVLRLRDDSLNQSFKELARLTEKLTSSLAAYRHPENEMKVKGHDELYKIPILINKEYEASRNKLISYFLMSKKGQ